jgi:hypothetical protein
MILHVLPGDAYVDTFRETGLDGEIAIFREALVEGDTSGDDIAAFLETRERYHASADVDDRPPYKSYVAAEIEKIARAGRGDTVNLWFEYELFCSANYWFCLNILHDSKADIYRVAPITLSAAAKWRGFGEMTAAESITCWDGRIEITCDDVDQGAELWLAFKSKDRDRLVELGEYDSPAFPYLAEVSHAAAELETRPANILREIVTSGHADLESVFPRFSASAGVYGFGDAQVKKLLEQITK